MEPDDNRTACPQFRRRTDIDKHAAPVLTGEDEYRIAIEAAGLGIFDYHPLSGELYWNSAAKEHFGLSSDAPVNYNVFLVGLHPADRGRAEHSLQRALQRENGGRLSMEYRTVGIEDGKERLISMTGQAFFNPWGEGVRLIGTTRDVTGHFHGEEELRESEKRYRILFDRSPVAKWVFDLETFRILEVNDAAVEQYGYSRDEFVHLTLADIRTAEEFEKLARWARTCCTKGEKFEGHVQTKHRKKNKAVIDVDVRYTEIAYRGRRAGLGTTIDMTDRRRAEEGLLRGRTLLAEAEKLSHTGAWEWDVLADRWTFSDEWLKIHGVEKRTLTPGELIAIAHPDDRPAVEQAFQDVRNGIKPYAIEHRIVRRDSGEVRTVRASGQFVRDAAGRIVRVYGFAQDITGPKQAEEALTRTVEELRRSNSELQQFAYVSSHDLQEPLRTIASYVELLAMKYKGKIDPQADKYISFAVEGANRMSVLLNDLLAYSRVGTRGKPFGRVNMRSLYERTVGDLRRSIKESGARITADDLPEVAGDDTQLALLLQNLIANAIKFRKPGAAPEIRISAERGRKEWVFGVHDNGVGIEPRFYERVFVIFQRLHTREEYGGTGIGLAICKRIVERHGGRIWVRSHPGEGSSFYFSIPDREVRDGTGDGQAR